MRTVLDVMSEDDMVKYLDLINSGMAMLTLFRNERGRSAFAENVESAIRIGLTYAEQYPDTKQWLFDQLEYFVKEPGAALTPEFQPLFRLHAELASDLAQTN